MATSNKKPKRSRILQLLTLPRKTGGAELVFERLAHLLREQGVDLYCVSNGRRPASDGKDFTVPMARLEARRGMVTVSSMITMAWSLQCFFRTCLRIRPSLVHVHFVNTAALYVFLFRRLFRYRIVLTLHGADLSHCLYDSCEHYY